MALSAHPNRPPAALQGLLALAVLGAHPASAQAPAAEQVIVTGSTAERAIVEAPYAIGSVDRDTLRAAGPQVNLSEALVRVPGLVVNNR